MTLEEIIKQRLAEVQKEIVLEATKKEPVKVIKSEDEEEVDATPTLKKKLTKESVEQLNESRSNDNKLWNDYGHKEVTDNYLSGLDGSDQDDETDRSNSFSVKLKAPFKIQGAKLHDSSWEHGVPEYKQWNKYNDDLPKKSFVLPKDQIVSVSTEHGLIHGHSPSHGFFRADLSDHEEIKDHPIVFDSNNSKHNKQFKEQKKKLGITESVEQLNELSKDTLKSYIKKTNDTIDKIAPHAEDDDEEYEKQYPKVVKKEINLRKATNKLNIQKITKESTVSDQVSALLEAEGLSDEFKEQAVTIFEAAVKDRVLQIQEELQEEFKTQLAEAKEELESDIDGFLSEAIQQWKSENEVAIKSNFKSQLAESFIDGMKALIAEHNIDLPEGQENALEEALKEVEKLNESFSGKDQEIASLQESINELKAGKILESFKSKMTQTEFDRFSQLTESVKFKDEEQYAKQLTVVLENFGSTKKEVKKVQESVITEQVSSDIKIVTESDSTINQYAAYMSKKR